MELVTELLLQVNEWRESMRWKQRKEDEIMWSLRDLYLYAKNPSTQRSSLARLPPIFFIKRNIVAFEMGCMLDDKMYILT